MKKVLILFITICFIVLVAGQAMAISISLVPKDTKILRGQYTTVDVNISGLTAAGAPTIGAFSLDILFSKNPMDPLSPLFSSPGNTVFGASLGNPNPAIFETITNVGWVVPSSPGGLYGVYLYEVSLLEANLASCIFCTGPYLDDLQTDQLTGQKLDSFTLATMTVFGRNLGSGLLLPYNVVLSDAFGIQLPDPTLHLAGINVVPEPSTLLLLGSGLFGLAGFRKKFKIKSS